MRYRADASLSRHEAGRVLLGGSPLTLFRLSEAGARVVERVLAGEAPPRGPKTEALVARLVDAGVLHPHPEGPGPWRPGDVSAVVPVLDRDPAALAGLVTGLLADGLAAVVVVDDGSRVPVSGVPGAEVVRLPCTGGPAAARMAGLARVTTPLVAFVDADVRPRDAWLGPLLAHLADPGVALVAPRVRSRPGPSRLERYEEAHSPLDLGPAPARIRAGTRVSYVPAAAVLVRRAVLEAIGGFDADLRTGEDVDLVWRLDEAGHRCRYEPEAVVEHEPRRDATAWWNQRAGYGRSAGPLSRRHPGALPPVAVSSWSAGVWGAAVLAPLPAGLPAAVALGAATTVLLRRKVGSWSLAARLTALGHLHAGRQLAGAVRRAWWPLVVPAAVVSRRARRVVALAALAGLRDGGPLRLLDDAAYAVGLWQGAWRARTAAPVLPDLTSWPNPSHYERRRRPAGG